MVMPVLDKIQCKVCGSRLTVREGKIKGIQRWKCKSCGRKFLDNSARFHMKTPYDQVTTAIRMYYRGISLNEIRQQLLEKHNYCPSVSTVYKWVAKYSHAAQIYNREYHPKVGDTWMLEETNLKVSGQFIFVWDVIDERTRFLLASKVPFKRDEEEVRNLLDQAFSRAGKTPKLVVAPGLAPMLEGKYPFAVDGTPLETTFRTLFEWRNELMSDLKRLDKVIEFVDGWHYYYNYFRPQESLGGKTPSVAASIRFVRQGDELFRGIR